MPSIEPFCGLRYNLKLFSDLSLLISPPYDVISPGEQRLYYHRNEFNIIRLELGEDFPADNENNNRYTRAAATLKDWLSRGILVRDPHPTLYIFQHCFPYQGITRTRWGLTARLRLEEWEAGNILPHEITLREPTSDRLKLLHACKVNLSPILGLFPHYQGGLLTTLPELVQNKKPIVVTDHYGIEHKIWMITNMRVIEKISRFYADKKLYIADGHHRYQTALIYKQGQMASGNTPNDALFNYVMVTLMDARDPGLLTLPTHRLVKLDPQLSKTELLARIEEQFYIEDIEIAAGTQAEMVNRWLEILQQRGTNNNAIGIVGINDHKLSIITPNNRAALTRMMPLEHCQAWKELDVSFLHSIVIKHILNIDSYEKERDSLEYTKDPLEAVNRVWTGEYQLSFLLNPIPVESVIAVANARDRMPQKSTHFYPKPPTGLVMNPLW